MRKAHPITRLLGSLNLAIFTLVFLATLLAVATWIEGQHGTRNANLWIYKTAWFDSVLMLVFINIFFATWLRYPFKRHQTGFVFTHVGILTILLGAFWTRQVGQEGMLSMFEGERGNAIVQDGTILQVTSRGQKLLELDTDYYEDKDRVLNFSLTSSQERIRILKVSAHSEDGYRYTESKIGIRNMPAVRFSLTGSMSQMKDQWLSLHNPKVTNPAVLNLGVATISLEKLEAEELAQSFTAPSESMGTLIIRKPDASEPLARISIKDLQKEAAILPDGSRIEFMDYYPFATVQQNVLMNDPEERFVNPAVRVKITTREQKEDIILRFQRIPDFKSSRETITDYSFELLDAVPVSKRAALKVILSDGKWYFISQSRSGINTGELQIGQAIPTGWMDFQFTLEEAIEQARPEKSIRMLTKTPGLKSVRPAVRFELLEPGSEKGVEYLIQYGDEIPTLIGDLPITVTYGPRLLYLPFSVTLNDFRKIDYPGTTRAMSYESDVTVTDPGSSPSQFDKTIKMNHILIHRSWKFYQADFEILDDGREISRLQVGYDPGTPLIYLGSIVMIFGICLMFWMSPKRTQNTDPSEESCAV